MRTSEEEGVVSYDPENPKEYYIGIYRYLLNFFSENEKMVKKILESSVRGPIMDLLYEQMKDELTLRLSQAKEKYPDLIHSPELLSMFYFGAMTQGAQWWLKNRNTVSKDAVLEQFSVVLDGVVR